MLPCWQEWQSAAPTPRTAGAAGLPRAGGALAKSHSCPPPGPPRRPTASAGPPADSAAPRACSNLCRAPGQWRSRPLPAPVGRARARSPCQFLPKLGTRSGGTARAITPRLIWSLRRMPAGRPAATPAIAADPALLESDQQPTALIHQSEQYWGYDRSTTDKSMAAATCFRGFYWCGREDSNFHGVSPTATSTLRVYQFRHDRIDPPPCSDGPYRIARIGHHNGAGA